MNGKMYISVFTELGKKRNCHVHVFLVNNILIIDCVSICECIVTGCFLGANNEQNSSGGVARFPVYQYLDKKLFLKKSSL